MSLIFTDSFDGYTTAEIGNYWSDNVIAFASAISTSTFRNGTAAMNPSDFGVSRPFIALGTVIGVSTAIIGFGLLPTAYSGQVISLWSVSTLGTSTVVDLFLNSDGTFRIARELGGSQPNLAQSSPKYPVELNHWHYIEWTAVIGASAVNQISIDGQLAYSGTVNTIGTNTTIATVNTIMLAGHGFNNFFDDLYVASGDGLGLHTAVGDSAVRNLMPTGDGSFTEWTPDTGTVHWSRINEIPFDGDSSYNKTTTPTTNTFRDSYKVSTTIIANTDIIPSAQLCQVTKNDGTSVSLTPILIIAGSQSTNTHFDYVAAGGYTPEFSTYDTNPNAVATWTGTTINTVEWGIKKL